MRSVAYDLVIRNGTIVDGSGSEPYRADLGIVGSRITTISKDGPLSERGADEVDAEGHVVSPGFIDGHTHLDAQVFWDAQGTSSCWHGVTTAVMGHCGFTLAPARPDERSLVIRNLERAEDMSPAALAAGIEWSWESFPEYLEAVDRLPKGINYAAHVGHSAIRTWAMGERAFEQAVAGDDDLEAMQRAVREAMEAGAFGLSTSRGDQHETSDNRPVASRVAEWSEVCKLVEVMTQMGGGLFQIAPGPDWYSLDDELRSRAWAELSDLAISSRRPMMFGLPATGPTWPERLEHLDRVAAAGGKMVGVSRSRVLTNILSFQTRLPFDKLPEWQEVRSRPLAEQRTALLDPETRARLVHAAHHGDYPVALGGEPKKPDYTLLRAFNDPLPPNPSIAELAEAGGADPVDLMIDLALASDFRQLFLQHHTQPDLAAQEAVMRHPRTVMTFSDSGAHVSQISDWSLQTYLLAFWVRHRQTFSLPEAVRMITSAAASAWGITDRGLIREGFVADLNVFDPATVGPELPVVSEDLPGGAKRLQQRAKGFLATAVAGQVTLREGEPTGALPGSLLRGPLAKGARELERTVS